MGAIPATAYAATSTYNIPGGRVVAVGGITNGANCDQTLSDINLPGIQLPGMSIPGSDVPDNSLPLPGFPVPDQPRNMLPDQPGDITLDQPETDGSQDASVNQVAELANRERAKAGLSPLSMNSETVSAAQTRAEEIEKSFSHTGPDGSSFNIALTEVEVSFRGAGEDIVYGQTAPQQVMEGWMNNPSRGANILDADYTSIGVGYYRNGVGVDHWAQLFIRQR